MEIWHSSHRTTPNASVLKSLTQAGLRPQHAKSHDGSGPGIVFFDEFSNELPELLRQTSRRGLERVLAISLSSRAIAPEVIWNLLSAGAADVFVWERCRSPAEEIAARFQRWKKVDEIVRSGIQGGV